MYLGRPVNFILRLHAKSLEHYTTIIQDLHKQGYRAPEFTVQYVCDLIPESARATVRVLDIGAGTGLVAKGVRKRFRENCPTFGTHV